MVTSDDVESTLLFKFLSTAVVPLCFTVVIKVRAIMARFSLLLVAAAAVAAAAGAGAAASKLEATRVRAGKGIPVGSSQRVPWSALALPALLFWGMTARGGRWLVVCEPHCWHPLNAALRRRCYRVLWARMVMRMSSAVKAL